MPSDIDRTRLPRRCREAQVEAAAVRRARPTRDVMTAVDGRRVWQRRPAAPPAAASTTATPPVGRRDPSDMNELAQREQEAQEGTLPATSCRARRPARTPETSGLPTAALVAIALLGLAGVGGGVYLLRDYLPPGLTSRLPGASR